MSEKELPQADGQDADGSGAAPITVMTDADRIAGLEARLEVQLREIAKRREAAERAQRTKQRLEATLKSKSTDLRRERKRAESLKRQVERLEDRKPPVDQRRGSAKGSNAS